MISQQFSAPSCPVSILRLISFDKLFDSTKDRVTIASLHLDPYSVAKAEEGGLGGTSGNHFDNSDFREAGIAEAALIDRSAWTAVGALVRDSAGPNDSSCRQGACPC